MCVETGSKKIVSGSCLGLYLLCLPVLVHAQSSVQVLDDTNTSVVLDAPAQRIVSLAPHLTELLFSIGAGSRIVGTVRFSDYPEAAKEIPVLGDAFTINIESIVALQPDLVVAWRTGGTSNVVEKLRHLGIAVYVNEAYDLESIAGSAYRLSQLVGQEETGRNLEKHFLQQLAMLKAGNVDTDRKVFFQISDHNLYTVNDDHLIGQAISVCGVRNVYGSSEIPVPIVSRESVLAANPDVIIISQPAKGTESPWVEKWSEFEGYEDRIRLINPALISRPSLRMVQGISELCRLVRNEQHHED